MLGRGHTPRAERRTEAGPTLPIFDRIVPSPEASDIAAQIEAWTKPGDIVLDVNGRGGWVARAALAGQRSAVDLEALSLTRLLADVVVRPPDPVRVDAAAAAISDRPLGDTTVRTAIDGLFASTCPVCEKPVVIESLVWGSGDGDAKRAGGKRRAGRRPAVETDERGASDVVGATGEATAESSDEERPTRREFRCEHCQGELGGPALRDAEPAAEDLVRADFTALPSALRAGLRNRFPTPEPNDGLPDQLLDLHTPRQLVGLGAILEGIELESRPAPTTAALRLAFLLAVDGASRLNLEHGRPASLHILRGTLKRPEAQAWREVNPWSAFEEGVKTVNEFVARVNADGSRPAAMRPVTDLLDVHDGVSNVALAESTPGSLRRLAAAGERIAGARPIQRVRLVIGRPPLLMTRDHLARVYRYTAWALGAGAASMLPLDELFRGSRRTTRRSAADELAWSLARSLAVAVSALSRTGHAVVLLDDAEPRSLVAAALGGAAAGYRLIEARLCRMEGQSPIAVFVPPIGIVEPGPRTRANRPLPPVAGGAGDPGAIAGQGVFTAPERLREGPFRVPAATSAIRDTAVEVLKARGEPAGFEQLLGDLLVGLDRSGQLARLACRYRPRGADSSWEAWLDDDAAEALPAEEPGATHRGATRATREGAVEPCDHDEAYAEETDSPPPAGHFPAEPAGPVDELLALIRGELDRSSNRRIRQIESGLYWLASDEDRAATAQPLADRVEWAVFSLLSSSRQMTRTAVFERAAVLFSDREAPDGELLSACLESYSAPGSTPEVIVTADRLERRSAEHDAMIAAIADIGHRLGAHVWIGRRQQMRRVGGRRLAEWLDQEELEISPSTIAWGPQTELERVDCAWYAPRRAAYLFEVEWTAMLGDAVLVRHSRFPDDDRVVRFLVIPPERAALVRHKLARSPLLRRAFADRNWHVFKWDRLAAFAGRDEVSLAALEPYLGFDAVPGEGEQAPPGGTPAEGVP